MKNFVCAIGLSLTLGCATAIVRPYVGEQQAWPTSVGSIANVRYDLPIFTTLPPAPYEVLAELRISSPLYARPEEGHLPVLCKKAIEIGADALVLVEGSIYFSTSYGVIAKDTGTGSGAAKVTVSQVNRFNPDSFRPGVTIVAIRWTEGPPPGLPAKYARYDERLLQPELPTETAPAVEPPALETPATPPPSEVPAAVLPAVPSELMDAAQPVPPPASPEAPATPAEQPAPAPPPTPEPLPAPPQRSAAEIMQEILEGPKAEPAKPSPVPAAP